MLSAAKNLDSNSNVVYATMRKYPVRAVLAIALPLIALIAALVIKYYYPEIANKITTFFEGAYGTKEATAISIAFLFYCWVFAPAFRSCQHTTTPMPAAPKTVENAASATDPFPISAAPSQRTLALAAYIREHYDIVDTNIESKDLLEIATKARAYFLGEVHEDDACYRSHGAFINQFWIPGSHLYVEGKDRLPLNTPNVPISYLKEEIAKTHIPWDDPNLFEEQGKLLVACRNLMQDAHINSKQRFNTFQFPYYYTSSMIRSFEKCTNRYAELVRGHTKKRNIHYANKVIESATPCSSKDTLIFGIAGDAHFDPRTKIHQEAIQAFKETLKNHIFYVSLAPKNNKAITNTLAIAGAEWMSYDELYLQEHLQRKIPAQYPTYFALKAALLSFLNDPQTQTFLSGKRMAFRKMDSLTFKFERLIRCQQQFAKSALNSNEKQDVDDYLASETYEDTSPFPRGWRTPAWCARWNQPSPKSAVPPPNV